MEKIFIALAALATLTAVSCVKDEQDPSAIEPAPEPVYDYRFLKLNELSGAGEDNEKFIELYNNGIEDIDLKGITINKDEDLTWTGKKGQVIKAGEVYLILGASNSTENGLTTGLSAKKTVIVELFAPDGTKLDVFQRGEKGSEWGANRDPNNGSWSRLPDGTGVFQVTPTATPGAVNNGTGASAAADLVGNVEVVLPAAKIVLNELNGSDKFIELYNLGDAKGSLAGWKMYKDDKTEPNWIGPEGLSLEPGEYLCLTSNETDPDYTQNFASGLSAKKTVKIALFDAANTMVDVFTRGTEPWNETIYNEENYSFARVPNGTGAWKCAEKTPGAENGDSKGEIKIENN